MKGLQRWMISRTPSKLGATMLAGGWILSCGGTYVLSSTCSGGLLLLNTVFAGLGGGIGATTTPEGDPSPISSTLECPPTGIPSSRGVLASLGLPKLADRWGLDRGSPLRLLPNPSRSLHLAKTYLDASHQKWGWTHPSSP